MALRVLLADESTTIRKVMQLALQDFGVEVKSVPVGLDVMSVTKSFQPDIIFADVLLAKKNGYEVCAELKSDASANGIPIILMWSGFMEFDNSRSLQVGADGRLEKPFDAETLRQLVRQFVPRVATNTISNFLSFPQMPEWKESPPPPPPAAPIATKVPPPQPPKAPMPPIAPIVSQPQQPPPAVIPLPDTSELSEIPEFQPLPDLADLPPLPEPADSPQFGDLDEVDEFQAVPLPKSLPKTKSSQSLGSGDFDKVENDQDSWSQSHLNEWAPPQNNPPPEGWAPLQFEEVQIPASPPSARVFSAENRPSSAVVTPNSLPAPQLDPQQIEHLVREQARELVSDIAWKILPDIVERVVREELQKLMKEADKLT